MSAVPGNSISVLSTSCLNPLFGAVGDMVPPCACGDTWYHTRAFGSKNIRHRSPIYPSFRRILVQSYRTGKLQRTMPSEQSLMSVQQLLREILDEKNRKLIPHSVTTRILCKLCWASVQYLEANILKENPRFEGLIPELCNSLILLFPVINVHEEEDNLGASCFIPSHDIRSESASVRISIVEALALMPIKVLSSSLKKILQGKQFLSDIDECTWLYIG
jgi:hypothetical protein